MITLGVRSKSLVKSLILERIKVSIKRRSMALRSEAGYNTIMSTFGTHGIKYETDLWG